MKKRSFLSPFINNLLKREIYNESRKKIILTAKKTNTTMSQAPCIDYYKSGQLIGYKNSKSPDYTQSLNDLFYDLYAVHDSVNLNNFCGGYCSGFRRGQIEELYSKNGEKIFTFIEEYSTLKFKKLNETTIYCDTFDFTIYIHNKEINIDVIKPDDYSQILSNFFKLNNWPSSERHIFFQLMNVIDDEIIGKVLINLQERIFSGENVIVVESGSIDKVVVNNVINIYRRQFDTRFSWESKGFISNDYRWIHKNYFKSVELSIFRLRNLKSAVDIKLPVELKDLIQRNCRL